tara:strand:+ start:137 stop:613 length:477 start_codon:yes stop_codon:yes gene_type:complete
MNFGYLTIINKKENKMTLIKWNPIVRPTLFNEIDSWFNNITSDFPSFINEESQWKPCFEVLNSKEAYRVRADLPGMVKKDVNIEINDDVITIKGERKNEYSDNNHYSEFSYGKFSRSFSLPDDVICDDIKASMKDGVLALAIPRMKQIESKTKKITIK